MKIPGIRKILNQIDRQLEEYTNHLNDLRIGMEYHNNSVKKLLGEYPESSIESFNEIYKLYELRAYVTIAILDMQILTKGFFTYSKIWEGIYQMRNAYLCIYETVRVLNKKNKDMHEIVVKYIENASEYEILTKKMKKFKRQFGLDNGEMSKIRNSAAGHFDLDFITFYDTTVKLEPNDVLDAMNAFIIILSDMYQLLLKTRISSNSHLEKHKQDLDKDISKLEKRLLKIVNNSKEGKNH
jgi:hypothetical protein